jgi:tetratricopeptide (TPR) repeat protein
MKKILLIIIIFIFQTHFVKADEYYNECEKLVKAGKYSQAIPMAEELVTSNPTAANYRLMAEAYEGAGNYSRAVDAYRKEAGIYRQKGDINAAAVEESKANSLDVEFNLYYTKPVDEKKTLINLAKGEPVRGCYIGVYIEDDKRILGNFEKFNKYAGKNHSTFYAYLKYGEPFPFAWCREIKRLGAIPHIAWEPDSLDMVKDDEYFRVFAEEAAKLDWPIFMRFASEMNGDWTPYTGNPSLYKEKFKLVHDIFEKRAPKVMMLWTPNSIPQGNIQDYYPGDDCVDWVGVNIYSVHHHGMDLSASAEKEDPTYLLEYVYKMYSSRKPIHVSEYGATHFCKACGRDVTGFGTGKMYQMYGSLLLKFPRVKCIDWFDCDSIHETDYSAGSPNDYSLTDNLDFLNGYRKLIAIDYFLGTLNSDGTANLPSYIFTPVTENTVLTGQSIITSFVRSWLKKPQINYYIDGVKVSSGGPPYYLEVSTKTFKPGTHALKAELEGDGKGVIAEKKVDIVIKEGSTVISIPEVEQIKEEVPLETAGSRYLWQEKWGGWHGGEETVYTPVPIPTEKNLSPAPTVTEQIIQTPTPTVIQALPTPSIKNPSGNIQWDEWESYIIKIYDLSEDFLLKKLKKEWFWPAITIIVFLIVISIIRRSKLFRRYWFLFCYVLKHLIKKDR